MCLFACDAVNFFLLIMLFLVYFPPLSSFHFDPMLSHPTHHPPPLCLSTALSDYSSQYETARTSYLDAAKALKMATGPYKASRDAYVAAGVYVCVRSKSRSCMEECEEYCGCECLIYENVYRIEKKEL